MSSKRSPRQLLFFFSHSLASLAYSYWEMGHPSLRWRSRFTKRNVALGALAWVALSFFYVRCDPAYLLRPPLVPTTPTRSRVCANDVTGALSPERVASALSARHAWGEQPFAWSQPSFTRRNDLMTTSSMVLQATSPRSWYRQRAPYVGAIVKQVLTSFLGIDTSSSWHLFDEMGPVTLTCDQMRVLGTTDEEKRVCWTASLARDDCVVFSIGSNNQWTFEEAVVKGTRCKVHTFDCTVRNPQPPDSVRGRVSFHPLCLGREKTLRQGKAAKSNAFGQNKGYSLPLLRRRHFDQHVRGITGRQWGCPPRAAQNGH